MILYIHILYIHKATHTHRDLKPKPKLKAKKKRMKIARGVILSNFKIYSKTTVTKQRVARIGNNK